VSLLIPTILILALYIPTEAGAKRSGHSFSIVANVTGPTKDKLDTDTAKTTVPAKLNDPNSIFR